MTQHAMVHALNNPQNQMELNIPMPFENTSGLAPLGHAVLVRPYTPEMDRARVQSKIIIPESVDRSTINADQRCIVIEVGPNAWDDEGRARAKPGDKVLVTAFAGYSILPKDSKDGQFYRVVKDQDIFCRIDF